MEIRNIALSTNWNKIKVLKILKQNKYNDNPNNYI